jgi:hypothetical protein
MDYHQNTGIYIFGKKSLDGAHKHHLTTYISELFRGGTAGSSSVAPAQYYGCLCH